MKRRTPGEGEFERRQEIEKDSGLGDLTDDISAERGELIQPPGTTPMGVVPPGFPPDVSRQQEIREDVEKTGVTGTLSISASVRSTFDTRPINSRDWWFTDTLTFLVPTLGTPGDFVTAIAGFVVPQGYVAILRGFNFFLKEQASTFGEDVKDKILLSLLVENIPQPQHEDLDFGQNLDHIGQMAWTHILANERQLVQMRIKIDEEFLSDHYVTGGVKIITNVRAPILLYGNLLLRTGVPIEMQQGNPEPAHPIVSAAVAASMPRRAMPIRRGAKRMRAPSGIGLRERVLSMVNAGVPVPEHLIARLSQADIDWINEMARRFGTGHLFGA